MKGLTFAVSMHEHKVDITSAGCCWHFDHAEDLASTDFVVVVFDLVVVAVVLGALAVFFVVVVLVVGVVVAGARFKFCAMVHLTG